MSDIIEVDVDGVQLYPVEVINDAEIEMTVTEQIVEGGSANLQTKSVSFTPTESAQSSDVTPDVGYDGMSKVTVGVAAIPDDYVGTAVPRRASSSLTASGATVTAPAGFYTNQASKSVQSGTAGTPTASKGPVSNHSIAVTPSVTNTEGYISGGTKTGTAVTVSASELVSGTKSITENGSGIDVTNYQKVDVSVSGGGGNTAKVTLSKINDIWTPDCSFSDLVAAYNLGMDIVVESYDQIAPVTGYWDIEGVTYFYMVEEAGLNSEIHQHSYEFTSSGVELIGTVTHYPTYDATAIASDVASGKVFYNANGRAVGTASGGTPAVAVTTEQLVGGGDHVIITGTDISDTTAVAADVASGKYFYTAAGVKTEGTASGGGSSYTLIASQESTLNVTTTSAGQTAVTIPCGAAVRNVAKMVYVRIRDKAGPRNGYFYGSDTWYMLDKTANGLTSESQNTNARLCYRYANGQYVLFSGSYGLAGYVVQDDGDVTIFGRYSSSTTGTINGTFLIEVYTLDDAPNRTPFG